MRKIVEYCLVLVVLFQLLGCAPVADTPGAMLIVAPSDVRFGPVKLLTSAPLNAVVSRVPGGGAAKPLPGVFGAIEKTAQSTITDTILIAAAEGDQVFLEKFAMRTGDAVFPSDFTPYVESAISDIDVYRSAIQTAIPEYIAQGSRDGTLLFADGIGKLHPMAVWKDGKIIASVPMETWDLRIPNTVKDFPELADLAALSDDVTALLVRNQDALFQYANIAVSMGYEAAEPLRRIVLTTKMDWGVAIYIDDSHVVTAVESLSGSADDAVVMLSEALARAPKLGSSAMELQLIIDSTQLPVIVDALNESPTLMTLARDPYWAGAVRGFFPTATEGIPFYVMRQPNQPVSKLMKPLMSQALDQMDIVVRSAPIDGSVPQHIEDAIRKLEGREPEPAVVEEIAKIVDANPGSTLKIVGIGLQVVGAVIIFDAYGRILFQWGPVIQLHSSQTLALGDPAALDVTRVMVLDNLGNASYQPAWWLQTGGLSPSLTDIWNGKASELIRQGEDPCGSFSLDDWRYPNVPAVTDGFEVDQSVSINWCAEGTQNNPKRILFYNPATGGYASYIFDSAAAEPGWRLEDGAPEALMYRLDTSAWAGISCFMEVHAEDVAGGPALRFTPACFKSQ